jgi:5-formyltetrahydrofolate cyclo-ligase
LLITPLLAFDRSGGRLGQGGGFYDRTLRELRRQGAVFAVGLAFAGQEVERTPIGPGDEPLDAVLTEKGYIAFRKG